MPLLSGISQLKAKRPGSVTLTSLKCQLMLWKNEMRIKAQSIRARARVILCRTERRHLFKREREHTSTEARSEEHGLGGVKQ